MNLNRHYLLPLLIAMLLIPAQDLSAKKKKQVKEPTDRELWAGVLYRMAEPVLSNMSEGKLQQNMLVELSPTWDGRNKKVTYMECFGRLMEDWHLGFHYRMMIQWRELSVNSCANGR